jgi:hypothetical protein
VLLARRIADLVLKPHISARFFLENLTSTLYVSFSGYADSGTPTCSYTVGISYVLCIGYYCPLLAPGWTGSDCGSFDAPKTKGATPQCSAAIHRTIPGRAISLIVIDIIIAYFFAAASFLGAAYAYFFPFSSIEFLYQFPSLLIRLLQEFIPTSPYSRDITYYLYAGTTFIPTLIYLTILATLIISKAILGIGIRVTKFLLERATEVDTSKDLAVYTLTGSLFSVIVLLLTAFTKLCHT